MDESIRVCRSKTTGLFYVARFLGDRVNPDHDVRHAQPHQTLKAAENAAWVSARLDNIAYLDVVVEFTIFSDIYEPPRPPSPLKKSRGRKKS